MMGIVAGELLLKRISPVMSCEAFCGQAGGIVGPMRRNGLCSAPVRFSAIFRAFFGECRGLVLCGLSETVCGDAAGLVCTWARTG